MFEYCVEELELKKVSGLRMSQFDYAELLNQHLSAMCDKVNEKVAKEMRLADLKRRKRVAELRKMTLQLNDNDLAIFLNMVSERASEREKRVASSE